MAPTREGPLPSAQAQGNEATHQGQPAGSLWKSLQWWPTLVAGGFAAFVALDLFTGAESGSELAPIVAASGLVYLAAAALQKPATAWLVFFISVIIITVAKIWLTELHATWILLAVAAAFAMYGLLRGATRPTGGLPLQAVAMITFGAAAAIALLVDEAVGAYLVAAGLFAHAAWDVYHHRTNRVVVRSMAEFCFVLDTLLALAIVYATLRG
jgi:hypothetical protein